MDIESPYNSPRKPSPGEEYQKIASYASRWIHQTFSIQLDQDALATLFSNLSAKYPALRQVAKAVVEGMEN